MFLLSERLSISGSSRTDARRYLKRALLFGAGLLLLWASLQLLPSQTRVPPVYSDDAGTVAGQADPEPKSGIPDVFSPGNLLAIVLLGGGVALAVHLRRRSKSDNGSTPITPLGDYTIGPNQSLRLIECGNEVLLIGVAAGQITLLRSYPTDRFERPLSDDAAGLSSDRSHFSDVLHRYAGDRARIESPGTTC